MPTEVSDAEVLQLLEVSDNLVELVDRLQTDGKVAEPVRSPVFVAAGFTAGVFATLLLFVGTDVYVTPSNARESFEIEAVQNGVAEWRFDPNGERCFVWGNARDEGGASR